LSRKAFPIRGRSEVVTVSSHAGRMAREFGLNARRSMELAIVVSELASNIVKHGISGEIVLILDPDAPPQGEITVEAHDVGPPIRDLQLAMIDGNDDQGPIDPALILRRGGLGTGLGAVARLADRIEYRDVEGGKTITARFYR
jgi:anti-sigma regulatory factor (Ser/Thr protein kinase)